jgi:hypothetical protein
MAYNPGVAFFIPFHELDPSEQSQCIFFTQKGARCRWTCQESHNRRAIELQSIIARSSESVNLDLLQEYVLCNCCMSGRARHRDRIEDIGLLIPLAQRWQDEIQRQAADQSNHTTAVQAFGEDILIPNPYATPATSPPSHTTIPWTPIARPCYSKSSSQTSFSVSATPSKSSTSPTPYEQSSPMTSGATVFAFQPFGNETRYDLRHREDNIPTTSISALCTSIFQVSLSEFRPHIAEPLPSDFVSWKILEPLSGRDSETGSLYIFDRTSSPGYVKIGWTARSVKLRLEDWSKCGYTPNLLFSVHRVPHALRAETLTHHELIKEWRRERMCKAEWCRKSHQEWFEISKERATRVLGDWAEFIQTAEPYSSEGLLKPQWKEFVKTMTGNGETITAKTCLEHYKASIDEEATLIDDSVSLGHTPKIEEQESLGNIPKVGGLENPDKALTRMHSLRVEQQALRSQIPPLERSLPKAETPPKRNSPFKEKPLSETEAVFDTKSLSGTQFLFAVEPPSKIEPFSKNRLPFRKKPLLKTEPLPKSEPILEVVPASKSTPVDKMLLSKQKPLHSPLLQSTALPQEIIFHQETQPSRSIEIGKPKAIHVITNSNTNTPVVGISSNPKVTLSVAASASALLSTINSPSATISGNNYQIKVHTIAEKSNNSQPLDSSNSSSESSPSNSSAITASPRLEAELISNLPAPLGIDIAEALLYPSTGKQDEVARTLTLVTQRQQNVEGGGEAGAENELLGCDGQKREKKIEFLDQNSSKVVENDMGTESDGWDEEETLVEDQLPMCLEMAALKIVDGLYNEYTTRETNGAPKGFNRLKVLESEVPLAVECVLQA